MIWRAKSWTKGDTPSLISTKWKLISNINVSWQLGMTSNAGDELDYNGKHWKAKWWNTDQPGTTGAWEAIGPARCP